jgi:alpha-mannosidase
MSYQRFATEYKVLPKEKFKKWKTPELPSGGKLALGGKGLKVELDLTTGLVDAVKMGGHLLITPGSFLPQVYADINHSWETIAEWQEPVSTFALATPEQTAAIIGSAWTHAAFPDGKPPISILEDGPIRTVVQIIFVHGSSYVVQRLIVNRARPIVHVEQTIFWAEHDRMLRWELRHDPKLSRLQAEKIYSIDDETAPAAKGDEMDFQHFLRFSQADGKRAFAVISHGTHAYRHQPGLLRLSVLRSPSYATHEHNVPMDFDRYLNRYMPRQDQGIRHAKFTLLFGEQASTTEAVTRASFEFAVPLDTFVYFPTNPVRRAPAVGPFAATDAPGVLISAMKKAEKTDSLVVRLWETAGRDTAFVLRVEGRRYRLKIGAHQLKTVLIARKTRSLVETDMLERPLQK